MGQSYFVWTYLIFRFIVLFVLFCLLYFFWLWYYLSSKKQISVPADDFTYAPSLSYPSSPIWLLSQSAVQSLPSIISHTYRRTLLVPLLGFTCSYPCWPITLNPHPKMAPYECLSKYTVPLSLTQCSLVFLKSCSSMTRT